MGTSMKQTVHFKAAKCKIVSFLNSNTLFINLGAIEFHRLSLKKASATTLHAGIMNNLKLYSTELFQSS